MAGIVLFFTPTINHIDQLVALCVEAVECVHFDDGALGKIHLHILSNELEYVLFRKSTEGVD